MIYERATGQLQHKDGFLEFIVPDVLKAQVSRERYRESTFDRQLAIKRTDADFLALGHPIIDAEIAYVGSYDFGGLTAIRHISEPNLAGRSGYLFLFVVRQRVSREDGDECLFQFCPVFVAAAGEIDDRVLMAGRAGKRRASIRHITPQWSGAFELAKQYLEDKIGVWDWNDDVEFLGLSWVKFE